MTRPTRPSISVTGAWPQITGVWLRGGENMMEVLVEVNGRWVQIINEFVPTRGNDGSVWPISHICERSGLEEAVSKALLWG